MNRPAAELRRSNRRLALKLGAAALAMFGFGYALVPFYDAFCRITGFNGKSDDTARIASVDATRWVTVEFNGDVMPGLPWRFEPLQQRMRVHPGEPVAAFYRATNLSGRASEGRAVPSVTPPQAARHFRKLECFCFQEQRLGAGESRQMPLTFVVSPDLPPQVMVLTLSYAFFPSVAGKTAQGTKI